jgi:uncharacterized protein
MRRYTAPMRERNSDPRRLDVRRFAQDGRTLQGEWALAGFERLASSLLSSPNDASRLAQWSATGSERAEPGAPPQTWLHLAAALEVTLQCQRCLKPMTDLLTIDRQFRFVADAEQAQRIDEESEDDVLVLERHHDLHALLEDELILALPIVPRHETCPEPLQTAVAATADDDESPKRPNPFAVLASLRGDGKPN